MEIKITCACGQDFKFEVEPVNGVMPCAIICPACGADDTQLANEFLAASSRPVSAAQGTSSDAANPDAGRLRVNRPGASAASEKPTSLTAEPAGAPPKKFYTRSMSSEADKPPPPSEENIPRGILGGVIAGAIGMGIWYLLTVVTGREFGIVAWFIGFLVGFGVRALGRQGTALLGVIAAICAALAILGGQFLEVNIVVNKALRAESESAYLAQLDSAKEGIDLKSDDEVRTWIAKYAPPENAISAQDIADFHSNVQTNLQKFINGEPSRQQFERAFISQIDSFSLRYRVFNKTISLFTVLWVCFGIVSAYKIGSA
jgi:hypothetical protein